MRPVLKFLELAVDRLNRLALFNPARWPYREHIGRITAVIVVIGYFIGKVFYFDPLPRSFEATSQYYLALNNHHGIDLFAEHNIKILWLLRWAVWIAENAILLGYLIAYSTRAEAVSVARGIAQVMFPFVVSALPMMMALAPVNFAHYLPVTSRHFVAYHAVVMSLIFTGAAINLVGLLTMRRAFSVMSEARVLVTRGIFKYVRHPLYTSHFIMFFGSLCLRIHFYTLFLYILFVLGQVLRAHIEEQKLTDTFPQYIGYKKVTGMFFPRIRGIYI